MVRRAVDDDRQRRHAGGGAQQAGVAPNTVALCLHATAAVHAAERVGDLLTTIAVTDQPDLDEFLGVKQVDDIGHMRYQRAAGMAQVRALAIAGERDRMRLVSRGPQCRQHPAPIQAPRQAPCTKTTGLMNRALTVDPPAARPTGRGGPALVSIQTAHNRHKDKKNAPSNGALLGCHRPPGAMTE